MKQYLVVSDNFNTQVDAETPKSAIKTYLTSIGYQADIVPYTKGGRGTVVEVSLLGGTKESQTYYTLENLVRKVTFSQVKCTHDDGVFFYIDAWKTKDPNEEGEIVAKVHKQTKEVFYAKPEYRDNTKIKKIVETLISGKLDLLKRR